MDNAIELVNVTKEYPLVRALDNLSFSVKKNSVHGFIGPNGAGKSTTMKIISGVTRATSGSLYLFGEEITQKNRKKYSIGYLPENPPLYMNMQVDEYLYFVAKLWKISKDNIATSINRVIETCSLSNVTKRIIGNLSKGFKQRVGLAQALIHNPSIIILDEPMSGLDPKSISEIRHLIKSLAMNHTVLFSTHQLHDVAMICGHISIVNNGQIVKSDKVSDIQGDLNTNQNITGELELLFNQLTNDQGAIHDFIR